MGDLVKLLTDLGNTIAGLQAQLADAQAALDVAVKQAYDKGFADGVASVPKGDKIYSQEEADALVKAAVDPLQAQIVEMQAKVEELQKQVDGMGEKLEQAKIDAKNELRAQLKEAYANAQNAENQLEQDFGKLLES